MSKKNQLAPFQVRTKPEIRKRIVDIAAERGISANDVASMAIVAGIDRVVTKLTEIATPEKQAA